MPIASAFRNSTVERTAWYYLGLDMFSLMNHVLDNDPTMSYFPATKFLHRYLYLQIINSCSARVGKVKKFFRNGNATPSIMKAELSSTPRWRYIRELNKSPPSQDDDALGDTEISSDSDEDDPRNSPDAFLIIRSNLRRVF